MTTFRFRFDAQGKKLVADAPPPAPVRDLDAALDALPQDVVAFDAPEPDSAALLNELKEWLEENHDFGMDLQLLENKGVLLTPPYWNYVSDAAAALVHGETRDAAAMEEQRQAVAKYAAMIEDHELNIETAMKAAAIASIASKAPDDDPAQRLRDGIAALPASRYERFLPPGDHVQAPFSLDARAWATELRQECDRIVETVEAPDWSSVEGKNWVTWSERFKQYRVGRRSFDMELEDLWLKTRDVGGPSLFRLDLGAMTIREWSKALLRARAISAPDWVEQEIVRNELKLTNRHVVLFVCGSSGLSPTAQWLPSKRYGCFWLDRTEPMEWELHYGRLFAAFEISSERDVVETARLREIINAERVVFLGDAKWPLPTPPELPYIENPRNIDDAVRRIEALEGK